MAWTRRSLSSWQASEVTKIDQIHGRELEKRKEKKEGKFDGTHNDAQWCNKHCNWEANTNPSEDGDSISSLCEYEANDNDQSKHPNVQEEKQFRRIDLQEQSKKILLVIDTISLYWSYMAVYVTLACLGAYKRYKMM